LDSRAGNDGSDGSIKGEGLSCNRYGSSLSTSKNVGGSNADRAGSELSKVGLSNCARAAEVVTKVVVLLGGALREILPSSIGINLNSVAIDTSRASALLPGDSGRASRRSGGNNSSSRSGLLGVDTRRRPLADCASSSSHLEGDGVSTASVVKSISDCVEGETVGVDTVGLIVQVHVLVLSVSG
jgi:hypothetical protein